MSVSAANAHFKLVGINRFIGAESEIIVCIKVCAKRKPVQHAVCVLC